MIQKRDADTQRNKATEQEQKAFFARDQARRTRYVAHVNLAQREWDDAHVDRVLQLLEDELPGKGEIDLRGFEWFYLESPLPF